MKSGTSDEKTAGARRKKTQPPKKAWPAQEIKLIPISQLVLNEHNAHVHTLEQIEQISRSMDEFGWTIPVLVDEKNVILGGHGRVRAARLKGWTEAPIVTARGWSEEQKRAYLIADNKIAENASWDRKRLQLELRGLIAADFNVALVGFSDEELGKLMVEPTAATVGVVQEVTMQICPTCGRGKRKVDP